MPLTLTDRLYVQMVPSDPSVAPLVAVQGQLRSRGVKGQFVNPARLHMTVLHIGELGRTYEDVRVWLPGLSVDTFLGRATWLHDQLGQLLPITTTVHTAHMALYGDSRTIALQLIAPDAAYELHVRSLAIVKHFFVSLGLEYVEAFMKGNANYKHALSLSPHISLMKHTQNPLTVTVASQAIDMHTSPICVTRH